MTEITIKEIGKDLAKFADQAEFTAQRSVIEELFPFILHASRRMSSRAISKWLADERGVKLSFVAVARALREKEKHLKGLVQEIEPFIRTFHAAFKFSPENFLLDESLFYDIAERNTPELNINGLDDYEHEMRLLNEAIEALKENWFIYPRDVLLECMKYVPEMGHKKKGKGGKK